MSVFEKSVVPSDPVAAIVAELPEGGVVRFAPGRYALALRPTRSLTLVGAGADAVVIDAGEGAACLSVEVDDIDVEVRGLSLTNGSGPEGGALALHALSRVTLEDCALRGNRSRQTPGGAIFASAGTLTLRRCQIDDNQASDGLALSADAIATVTVEGSVLRGAAPRGRSLVRVRDGALVTLDDTTVEAGDGVALHVSGTTSRAPEVRVTGSRLGGHQALELRAPGASRVEVGDTRLSTALPEGATDLGGNRVDAEGAP